MPKAKIWCNANNYTHITLQHHKGLSMRTAFRAKDVCYMFCLLYVCVCVGFLCGAQLFGQNGSIEFGTAIAGICLCVVDFRHYIA